MASNGCRTEQGPGQCAVSRPSPFASDVALERLQAVAEVERRPAKRRRESPTARHRRSALDTTRRRSRVRKSSESQAQRRKRRILEAHHRRISQRLRRWRAALRHLSVLCREESVLFGTGDAAAGTDDVGRLLMVRVLGFSNVR